MAPLDALSSPLAARRRQRFARGPCSRRGPRRFARRCTQDFPADLKAVAPPTSYDINGSADAVEEASSAPAAEAAVALLRRFAKVGPEAPFSEIETRCRQLEATKFVKATQLTDVTLVGEDGTAEVSKETMLGAVSFDLGATIVYEVTPYAEIYGLHPREFVFDRHFYMMPSADNFGFVGLPIDDEEDSESDEDSNGSGDRL